MDDDFGDHLDAPGEYDPFEISKPIPRQSGTGPIEPLLIPRNVRNSTEVTRPVVKVAFWNRPKPTKDWYWFLGRLGSGLIILGVLMFLFVGYQLWGTGIEESQSQNKLEKNFAQIVVPPTASTAPPTDATSLVPTTAPPDPITVTEGDPLALIEMPTIGVTKYVVAGVETADLKKGPGHYPDTAMPGELGNVAIAGHRTTYGEPFRHLDDLVIGDPIIITDLFGRSFTYLVSNQQIVGASDSWVVATTDTTRSVLTLTTCHPEFSAKQRLIISAELDLSTSEVAINPAATYRSTSPTTPPEVTSLVIGENSSVEESLPITESETSTIDRELPTSADALSRGWFSDPSAIPQTILWALLELIVLLGSWQVAKKYRNRIIGMALGFVPFILVLYFVFQNFNRLLPPNL